MKKGPDESLELENWQTGAQKFRRFWEAVDLEDLKRNMKPYYGGIREITQSRIADLQAVFLKEKPSTYETNLPFPSEILNSFGLQKHGPLVYDPELLQKVVNNNSSLFNHETDIKKCIDLTLETADKDIPLYQERLGILLGYPPRAVRRFRIADEIDRNRTSIHALTEGMAQGFDLESSQEFNAYGVTWADYPSLDCTESEAFRDRLKRAFETSGILEINLS